LTRSGPTDSALWQDDVTREGYFIYSGDHKVGLEKLTDDFLGTLGSAASSGPVGPNYVEAPMFFRRNGLYYLVFGPECCYCADGSTAVVYTSCNPLGPYTATTNLSAGIPSQSTDITRFWDQSGAAQFMFRGDRWQQAPDAMKGHDPTYFGVMRFNGSGVAQPLAFVAEFNQSVSQLNHEGYVDVNTMCP
jgi:beta-xylosidase